MQTIEIKGWVFLKADSRYGMEPYFTFFDFDVSQNNPEYIKVCEHKIVTEVAEGFDPRAAQIAALQQQKEKVRAELGRRIAEIEDQISKLQAIEYTPAQEAA